ncbi:hypothetical protein PVAND_001616 [Polypedilum vanderplanki]|uniref:Uncharacterized protein n=1 Tax=Polypedilum vanderplanki TaxID=319348 RepID=A0A9J6BNR6_POLVA|nr:hypothetical protein PVAND_001616 [Polypedilum vanderplanki]
MNIKNDTDKELHSVPSEIFFIHLPPEMDIRIEIMSNHAENETNRMSRDENLRQNDSTSSMGAINVIINNPTISNLRIISNSSLERKNSRFKRKNVRNRNSCSRSRNNRQRSSSSSNIRRRRQIWSQMKYFVGKIWKFLA